MPSGNEKEVLQTLNVLDICLKKCGVPFQNEVGKFRFLNELIKLVSPKYLGSDTPISVKQKILQLLYVWTLDYPKETKIKEAFAMLRKQGVIKEIPNQNVPSLQAHNNSQKKECTLFQDQEKAKILQKLLQSKDPEDIQAANWLIKSMVKEVSFEFIQQLLHIFPFYLDARLFSMVLFVNKTYGWIIYVFCLIKDY